MRVSHCAEELSAQLPGVIGLEVDVLLRERGPTDVPPERIEVRCAEDRASIAVTLDGVSRESSIELGVLAPEHRARAVALAAAELVHSMSNQRAEGAAKAPPVAVPSTSASAPSPSPPPEAPRRRRPVLLAGGLAEWLGTPATPLFGARVGVHYPLGSVLTPALSVDGSFGSFVADSVDVSAATVSFAAHLYFGAATGSVRWDAGPGARLGWARLEGQPNGSSMLEGRALSAAFAGPEARARATLVASTGAPVFAFELGAGRVVLPVRGMFDGAERIYAVDGFWLSACAELGISL